ncbi:glutaredoxin-domain-containing protein [Microstroma glucosiphilum]|uniref:Glutaredoxin-domain-containing protein n=1 Tax=Pseudomicrostroma glucosiphilum TaxID=1684307 RepID=A0A316U9A9_9BASI|nr:glutaredoxin-domain-containing protein [Pseudomicrostroma glucosiphilum]PWN21762.1 glutaredoxin-domain-containing protein [Pseudomicrostroma glucosiphilum]
MPKVSIDLERGASKGLHGNYNSAPLPLPAFRRRKRFLVLLLLVTLGLIALWHREAIPGASSGIRWVKDSMKTNGAPEEEAASRAGAGEVGGGNVPVVDNAVAAVKSASAPVSAGTSAAVAAAVHVSKPTTGQGTEAFRKLAAEQGYTPAETDRLAALAAPKVLTGPPTSEEKMLLLMQALTNYRYSVPEDGWKSQLMPASPGEFASRLAEVQGAEGIDDVKLYKDDRTRWNVMHREQHPLVVFSKSYCPYSKKAKSLLTSLGAHYTVYEVDQRPHDASSLQEALAAISGHRTFPAVFARGRLLGGSDELARLNKLNVLRGVLSGAGAL